MITVREAEALRAAVDEHRAAGRSIGFVPTLGCLHAGHASLIDVARAENDVVVASVFVNPLQFRPDRHAAYPRDLQGDQRLAAAHGVDLLFAPDWPTLYPGAADLEQLFALQDLPEAERPADTFERLFPWSDAGSADAVPFVRAPRSLACRMDGAHHPWHFDGVVTVVARLFELVRPDRACFGEKDPQQVALLAALARWLGGAVTLRRVPTLRDPDGLAASSRNTQLAPADRPRAVAMAAVLRDGARAVAAGVLPAGAIRRQLADAFATVDAELEYVDLLDPDSLDPLPDDSVPTGRTLLYLAYLVDGLRLTDTWTVGPGDDV